MPKCARDIEAEDVNGDGLCGYAAELVSLGLLTPEEGLQRMAAAGLAGILNERPSGGFLHSLARQLAALEKAFEACDRAKQS